MFNVDFETFIRVLHILDENEMKSEIFENKKRQISLQVTINQGLYSFVPEF